VRVSIDTTRAPVAAAALEEGAAMVNDVSGGRGDPAMAAVVRCAGVPFVVMHSRGPSATMQQRAAYGDVVAEVFGELCEQVERLRRAGIAREQLVVDPGLGFAKQPEHNWALLARLPEFRDLGPVLVGASRKSFLAGYEVDGGADHARDAASLAVATLAAAAGAYAVRVHDVARTVAAVGVVAAASPSTAALAYSSSNSPARSLPQVMPPPTP
jgi:dihydropteroate synthase